MISKYAPLLLGLILGIALGLVYGWVIQPGEVTGSSPDALREDYRIDMTVMIAKAYAHEADLDQARTWLMLLNPQDPAQQAQSALAFAEEHEFSPGDIEDLHRLLSDLKSAPISTGDGGG